MATNRIKVRNRNTGAVAWLPEKTLRHFPDFEPADNAAAPAPARAPKPAPAPAVSKTTRTATSKKEGSDG